MAAAVIIIPILVVTIIALSSYLVYKFLIQNLLSKRSITQTLEKYNINKTTFQIIKEYYENKGESLSDQEIQKLEKNYIQNEPEQFLAMYDAIRDRLNQFYVDTEVISITDFEFSPLFAKAIESKVEAEQKAQKAENDLIRIEVEARQLEAQAVGTAAANIAEAQGEAEAISIINQALSQNPYYLEWLKTQAWDGKLPLVVGEGGTPFIAIPTTP